MRIKFRSNSTMSSIRLLFVGILLCYSTTSFGSIFPFSKIRTHFGETKEKFLHRYSSNNNSWFFRCKSGQILAKWRFCNGHVDCRDGSDETVEYCGSFKCHSNQFKCWYGACIDEKQTCDNIYHCADGSDELLHCNAFGCPIPENSYTTVYYVEEPNIQCSNTTFAKQNAVLKYYCINASCPQGRNEEIRCKYGKWTPYVPCCVTYSSTLSKCTTIAAPSTTTEHPVTETINEAAVESSVVTSEKLEKFSTTGKEPEKDHPDSATQKFSEVEIKQTQFSKLQTTTTHNLESESTSTIDTAVTTTSTF